MNSLAYLARQLDALAASPPPTPPSARGPGSIPIVADDTALKRVRTWSDKSTPFPSLGHDDEFAVDLEDEKVLEDGALGVKPKGSRVSSRTSKRSFSSPSLFLLPSKRLSAGSSSSKSSGMSPVAMPSKRRRAVVRLLSDHVQQMYIYRALLRLWEAACSAVAWAAHMSRRKRPRAILVEQGKAEEDSDEKERETSSSEDEHPQSPRIALLRRQPQGRPPATDPAVPPGLTPPSDSPLTQNAQVAELKAPSRLSATPPPGIGDAPPRRTPLLLPKTLVLDLDETLIHSTTRPMHMEGSGFSFLGLGRRGGKSGGHVVEVVLGGRSTTYHVYKRPYVDYFLRKVSGWYTLVIFTASMQEYADPVIDWLDAGRGILARRFFRPSCTQLTNGSYAKDLSVVEEDLARVCLVDNSPVCYTINPPNGIPIEGWTSDPNDEALLDLLPVLDSLRFTSDVRRILSLRLPSGKH